MADFNKAYSRTSIYEGGYANVKGDRGGETYAGITKVYHPNWEGWKIIEKYKPLKYQQKIKDTELERLMKVFYKKTYWDIIQGDLYDSQIIAEFIYDYSVHSGPKRAITKLQGFLGVVADGKVGKLTIAALNSKNPKILFEQLKRERYNFLLALSKQPNQEKFRKGWLNRINNFKYESL